jgi:hypothetical protein
MSRARLPVGAEWARGEKIPSPTTNWARLVLTKFGASVLGWGSGSGVFSTCVRRYYSYQNAHVVRA